MITLFNWLAQRPKCLKNCVTENPELFQDNPNLVEGFDSPICLIYTIVKIFIDYYYFKIVSHQFNVSEDSYLSSHLALDDKPSFFAILWLVLLASIYGLKGCLDSIDTHHSGLGSHIFRSFSSTIDSPCFGDKKKKFTIHCHYSMSLFICYYSWHCSLRIFAYLRGLSLMFETSFS